MRPKLDLHLDYFIVAALMLLSYVVFLHQLGAIGFLGPDEPRYAGVARGMFETGDFITPRLDGENWFEKPVLMYWLAAMGYAVFGVGETGARLPSALGATMSVFLVYWIGRRMFTRGTGFAAALILMTSIGFFGFARAASMDMLLTAALTGALAFFLAGIDSEEPRRRWFFYLFYALLGVGALAKGPVALILPALPLGLFLVWRTGLGEWKRWHPEGILVTALIAGPWYTAVTWVNGREFFDVFILSHNLQRFTTDVYGHVQPFYYYAPVLLLMIFPWSFLAIPALARRFSRGEHLLLMWALVPLVFFSLSGSKLPAYILPVTPAIALLAAREIAYSEATWPYRVAVFLQAAVTLAIGIVLGFFPDALNVDLQVGTGAALGISAVIAGLLVAIGIWLPPPALGLFNVVKVALIVFVLTTAVAPRLDTVPTMQPWADELDRFVSDDQSVVLYKPDRWIEYGLAYYRNNPRLTALSEEELSQLAPSGRRTLCLAESGMLDELSTSATIAIEVVHTIGDVAAFWVWKP